MQSGRLPWENPPGELDIGSPVKQVSPDGSVRYGQICNIHTAGLPLVRWDDIQYSDNLLLNDEPWGDWSEWSDLEPLTRSDEAEREMIERLKGDAWAALYTFKHGPLPASAISPWGNSPDRTSQPILPKD